MKCHYEVLGVTFEANDDDFKKAYRKLALQWHPDKNLDNAEEAKKQFQLIQAAYELLSDPQERAWYDKHRDAILLGAKGSEYQDNAVNIFEYFTSACYSGFGEDEQSFYAVYKELFNQIAAEDMEFAHDEDSDFEIPEFGNATSDYDEVVRPFYAYWQSYCTLRPYSWLDKYPLDALKEVPRRVQRLMERDNKKLREAGRKQRNEEIRTLVSFVRKRDPRVKAYIKLLEEKAAQNVLKMKKQQEKHREERRQLLENTAASRFAQMTDLEQQLKDIEAQYASSNESSIEDDQSEEDNEEVVVQSDTALDNENVGVDEAVDSDDDIDDELMELYCPACKKMFKTVKARESHDRSKKHQEKVRILRQTLLEEDGIEDENGLSDAALADEDDLRINSSADEELEPKDDSAEDDDEVELSHSVKKTKKKKKKTLSVLDEIDQVEAEIETGNKEEVEAATFKTKRARRNKNKSVVSKPTEDSAPTLEKDSAEESDDKYGKKSKKKATKNEQGNKISKSKANRDGESLDDTALSCAVCKEIFQSKNKLFDHLKATKHAIFVEKAGVNATDSKKRKKRNNN